MPSSQDTKKAKREAARQARIEQQRARERARRRRRIGVIAAVGAVVLIAGGLVYQRMQEGERSVAAAAGKAGCTKVKQFAEQDRDHIPANAPDPKYNSNPPTSGPHLQQPANWGSYDEPVDDKILIHNLEHGGVIIHYKGISDAEADRVSAIADDHDSGVIAQPNEKITKPIALTAWRNLQTCEKVSEPVIRDFISEYCNKGPEKFGLAC